MSNVNVVVCQNYIKSERDRSGWTNSLLSEENNKMKLMTD